MPCHCLRLFLQEKTRWGARDPAPPAPNGDGGQPRQHQAISKPPKLQHGAPPPTFACATGKGLSSCFPAR